MSFDNSKEVDDEISTIISDLESDLDEYLENPDNDSDLEDVDNLKYMLSEGSCSDYVSEIETLIELLEFREAIKSYTRDWRYGVTLIDDNYTTEHFRSEIENEIEIPSYVEIDWDKTAENLLVYYSYAEYDGTKYWFRNT